MKRDNPRKTDKNRSNDRGGREKPLSLGDVDVGKVVAEGAKLVRPRSGKKVKDKNKKR